MGGRIQGPTVPPIYSCVFIALSDFLHTSHTLYRTKWIIDNLGMVTLVGSQIWWTWETEDVFRRVREGNKHGMKDFAAKLTAQLSELTTMVRWFLRGYSSSGVLALSFHQCTMDDCFDSVPPPSHPLQVRSDLSNEARKKANALIIIDVHARDIIDTFVRDSIMDAREFAWESQLRFYWDRAQDDILIRQCTGVRVTPLSS